MLQAEILVQYGMRSKAIERLQRIQELFPREEERNQDLQRLYIAAGIEPQYAKSASTVAPAATRAPTSDLAQPAARPAAAASEAADVSSLAKVAEITRKLYHQGNAEGVLKTAANEIGANWRDGALHRGLAQTGAAAVERAGISHGRSDSGECGGAGQPGGSPAGSGGGARHGHDRRREERSRS